MGERGFERPWVPPCEEALQLGILAVVWVALMLLGAALF